MKAGIGKVGFKVSGPGFSTAKDYPIQTRLGWSQITRTTIDLKTGESFTPTPDYLKGLAAGDASLQVSYSPFRGFDPAPIANALTKYPYGCTEQTVSAAYPLLYATEVGGDPKLKRSTTALAGAVGRLLDRQTLDGAFGLWRVGDGEADAWLGAYATDFLIEAKGMGAPVPQEAIDRALSAMRQISRPRRLGLGLLPAGVSRVVVRFAGGLQEGDGGHAQPRQRLRPLCPGQGRTRRSRPAALVARRPDEERGLAPGQGHFGVLVSPSWATRPAPARPCARRSDPGLQGRKRLVPEPAPRPGGRDRPGLRVRPGRYRSRASGSSGERGQGS